MSDLKTLLDEARKKEKPVVVARCPRCNSRWLMTARSKNERWCRRCGHRWPLLKGDLE